MRTLILSLTLSTILFGVMIGDGPAAGSSPGSDAVRMARSRELVCIQPGDLYSDKIPADTAEVANDCLGAGTARLVRATWWGGYIDWVEGDPEVTRFNVRFYNEFDCTPTSLIAEYLSVTPDTTHLGNCGDSFPCFRYDLEIDVQVGPGPFWMAVQGIWDLGRPRPPMWGRLGDEVFENCPSTWRVEGGQWLEIPPEWDASHQFETATPTATERASWGEMKGVYR